jgi:galactoside O-acetyltransferase
MAKIVQTEVISLGDSVVIDDFVFIMGGKKTILGSFTHVGCHSSILGGGEFIMDDFSTLSGGVRLYTGTDDYNGGSMTNPAVPEPYRIVSRSFIRIAKHVIVGTNSVLLPGIKIGEGAAIGACSLVKHDCEPWTIYAGSPAKPIKTRPKEKILELESQLKAKFYDRLGNYIPNNIRRIAST